MFQPGQSGNPNGRPVGSKNAATQRMRNAFAMLLEDNLDNMNGWLHQVAAEDPGQALKLLLDISKRFIPTLTQQALTNAEGNELFKNVTFNFGQPQQDDEAA